MVISNIHNDYDIELKYDENILRLSITTNISELLFPQTINGQSI